MTTTKALLDFASLPLKTKLIFYRNVLARLTSNPIYLNPDVSLASLKTAVDNFELAILAADDGGHTAKSAMHDSDTAVTLMFKNTAAYVNRIANGDETKILSSGFTPSSQPAARNKAELAIIDGPNSGSAKIISKSIDHAGAYEWEKRITTKAGVQGIWQRFSLTTQSYTFIDGLEVGSILEVKVCGVTPTGVTDFCAPVSKLVN